MESEMKYRILDSNSLILLTGSCILSIAENINMRCDDMKSPGKRIKTEKTSVVTSHVSINAGGVVQAQELATKYTQDALAIMRKLPDQPAKTDLISLTKRLLDRHN